jgi:hypothetical protein
MKFATRFIFSFLILTALGCANTYKEKSTFAPNPPKIPLEARVYVSMPLDAVYKKKVMFKSGNNTAEAVADALARYSKAVFLAKQPESRDEALASAEKIRAEYLIMPTILKWEDKPTEWTGVRDKMTIKLEVIQVAGAQTIYAREISGKSRWLTEGGDTPADLLDEPIETFANSLYQRIEVPTSMR